VEKMTGDEFRMSYACRQRDFSKVDLSGVRVTGSVSDEDFFVQIDLREVDFSGSNLSGADLSGANFTDANFSGANLSGADLTQITMTESILDHTNFTRANLKQATVSNFGLSPNLTSAQNLHSVTNYSSMDD
jgi:uncharacterized protein YjbI with pentapeptide repeats